MPTVIIGNNTGDDYSGTEDTRVYEYSSISNYGGSGTLDISKYDAGGWSHGLFKFSGLSNITGPVTVTSSSFTIYCSGRTAGTRTFTLRRVLRNWNEGSLTGGNRWNEEPWGACWTEYGAGNTWSSNGGVSDGNDRSSTSTGTITVSATGEASCSSSAQLNADIEDFINGDLSNYGWHFERTDGSNDSKYDEFTASEGTDGQRPYLTVTYTESGGASGGSLVGASALVGGGVLCGQGNLIN